MQVRRFHDYREVGTWSAFCVVVDGVRKCLCMCACCMCMPVVCVCTCVMLHRTDVRSLVLLALACQAQLRKASANLCLRPPKLPTLPPLSRWHFANLQRSQLQPQSHSAQLQVEDTVHVDGDGDERERILSLVEAASSVPAQSPATGMRSSRSRAGVGVGVGVGVGGGATAGLTNCKRVQCELTVPSSASAGCGLFSDRSAVPTDRPSGSPDDANPYAYATAALHRPPSHPLDLRHVHPRPPAFQLQVPRDGIPPSPASPRRQPRVSASTSAHAAVPGAPSQRQLQAMRGPDDSSHHGRGHGHATDDSNHRGHGHARDDTLETQLSVCRGGSLGAGLIPSSDCLVGIRNGTTAVVSTSTYVHVAFQIFGAAESCTVHT